jgi:hypothetical protein
MKDVLRLAALTYIKIWEVTFTQTLPYPPRPS